MLNKLSPGSNIVFSNSLPRMEWHYSINHRAMKDIPKRLNRGIRSYCLQQNGCYIKYDDLDDCHDVLFMYMMVFICLFYERTCLLTHYRELLNSSF